MISTQMVWTGEGLQYTGDGFAGTQSGGPLQFLWSKIHYEDRPHAG